MSKLLKGIFVSLLLTAVARINSTTVLNRSLFSCGSCETRVRKEWMRADDGAGMAEKVGMANVDREGGLRMAKPDLGPLLGRPGRAPRRMPPLPPPLKSVSALVVVSLFTAASKSGDNLQESMVSGTTAREKIRGMSEKSILKNKNQTYVHADMP